MKNKKSGSLTALDLTYIAFFAALISICAWIKLPLTIPVTMQSFGVFTATLLLGGKRASLCITLYIFLGTIGLPVFSGFSGGPGILFGNTGGYILGFLCIPLLHWWMESKLNRSACTSVASLLIGLLFCYALGTFWYAFVYLKTTSAGSLLSIVAVCVVPFILPDIIKLALAIIISAKTRRHIRKS